MTKIFISYRRHDTMAIAGRIFDRLVTKFTADGVFMDIDSIPIGVDFHGWLDDEVSRAAVVLALIGPGWINAQDEAGQRRLDSPDDFVRIELESALRRNIAVVPVLIGGAAMPKVGQLPDTLRPLARRNAALVDIGRDFHMHMDRLITGLERLLQPVPVKPPQPALSPKHDTSRLRAEGRIEIDAPIVHNAQGRWFLPGAGKTEWFKDFDGGPEMVMVPAGDFMMGSPEDEPGRFDAEGPQHKVVIPGPFAVGRYAVTRGEFSAFVDETGYSVPDERLRSFRTPGFVQDSSHPVVFVNWHDAQAYVQWLSQKTGKTYRLSSEAEWEYAARAGTTTPYWWGGSISREQANYGKAVIGTVPVNRFHSNPRGLYQVHGNAWEWCADHWHGDYEGAPVDGSVWQTGDAAALRVFRGGAWSDGARRVRAACRGHFAPFVRLGYLGFRCVRVLS